MATEIFNRKEKKYMLNNEQYEQITEMISDRMSLDKYNKNDDFYYIYNIYYDTNNDTLIRRSIEKPVYKEKFRLRVYGKPELNSQAFLEIKKKYKGIVNKRRITMRLDEAYDYLDGYTDLKSFENDSRVNMQILTEIDYFKKMYNIKPKLFLSYERRAYYDNFDKDFRVTFDKNIITRRSDLRLEDGNYGKSLLPDDVYLMEVKITGAVPLWFVEIISELNIYPVSFSKYGTEYKNYILNKKGDNEVCFNQFSQVQQIQPWMQVRHCLQ